LGKGEKESLKRKQQDPLEILRVLLGSNKILFSGIKELIK